MSSEQPATGAVPVVSSQPAPAPRRGRGLRAWLGALTRRLALWGAGADGEHLASWSPARPAPGRPVPDTAQARPPRRSLVRRLALWGSGADGEHLASWSPARPA